MIWQKDLQLSEELYRAVSPIFGICRLFGILPFSITRNAEICTIKVSKYWMIYSALVAFVSAGLALDGLLEDGGNSAENTPGDHQSTSTYVVTLKVLVIQITVIIGIFGAPLRLSTLHNFANNVTRIDLLLPDPKDGKKSSNLECYCTILIVFLTTGLVMSLELNDGKTTSTTSIFRVISYAIVMILECQYWCMTTAIRKRIAMLNNRLSAISKEQSCKVKGDAEEMKEELKSAGIKVTFLSVEYYEEFIKIYIYLCDAIDELNDCCGLFVAAIILIDLLQLTLTGYFFVIQLQKGFNFGPVLLMLLSFLAYLYRLLVLVEPCQSCLQQAKLTIRLVCRLLCSEMLEIQSKSQLNILYEQISQRQIEFSVYGFGNVDRTLITTIAATVATYLVTVVQFQFSED